MSTRSNIAIEQEDGSVKVAYCHYDGYLEQVGISLLTEYETREKADELIDIGNMRTLGDASRPEEPVVCPNLGNYMAGHVDPVYIEYIYLWRDDEWQVSRSMIYDTPDGFTKSQCYHTDFKPLHEQFWLEKKTVNS